MARQCTHHFYTPVKSIYFNTYPFPYPGARENAQFSIPTLMHRKMKKLPLLCVEGRFRFHPSTCLFKYVFLNLKSRYQKRNLPAKRRDSVMNHLLFFVVQEAMGLGLGMNVEPHSLMAAAAVSQEESTKYIPPAARGDAVEQKKTAPRVTKSGCVGYRMVLYCCATHELNITTTPESHVLISLFSSARRCYRLGMHMYLLPHAICR